MTQDTLFRKYLAVLAVRILCSFVLFYFSFSLSFCDTRYRPSLYLKSCVKLQTTQIGQNQSLFGSGIFDSGLRAGDRMKWRGCRLRSFNKLRCFHGIWSINMCYEERYSKKISTKILSSGEVELMTVVYQVGNIAYT